MAVVPTESPPSSNGKASLSDITDRFGSEVIRGFSGSKDYVLVGADLNLLRRNPTYFPDIYLVEGSGYKKIEDQRTARRLALEIAASDLIAETHRR